MLTIRCTQKLLKELHLSKSRLGEPDDGFLGSWFANLFRLERRKCVIFTNDRTLYCVVLFGLLKRDFENLGQRFVKGLTESLQRDGFPVEKIASVGVICHPVAWGVTNNRSVLGSANDLIQQLKWRALHQRIESEQDVAELNMQINRIPMGALGYKYAIDRMSEELSAWSP